MNKDKYNEMLRIKKEMNSGILFKDRIDIYKSLVSYVENNDIELAVYKEKEMIRLIEEDELFAFDYNNRYLQIVDKHVFEYDDVYLVKKPNRLFYLNQGEKIEKIVGHGYDFNFENRIGITYDNISAIKNITILCNRSIFDTWGNLVFSNLKHVMGSKYKKVSISYDNVIKIINAVNYEINGGIIDLIEV